MIQALLFVFLSLLFACGTPAPPPPGDAAGDAAAPAPLRVGWQTTWATQGQLAVILKNSDILKENGFRAEFKGFSYGGPLNEGALAGEVDVLFTADQPALSLAARAPRWGIIGRLMSNRVGVLVPPDSPVTTPAALRGRSLAVPFGSAAQREAMRAAAEAGLDTKVDLKILNLDLQEIVALVGAGAQDGRWGEVDAVAAWDPALANLEGSGAARVLATGLVTSVVLMDDRYLAAHPGADARFMSALGQAYAAFLADKDAANAAFKAESKLPFEVSVLERAAAVEPNLALVDPSGIRVTLSPEEQTGLQGAADFMLAAGLLKEPVQVQTVIRPTAIAR